MGRLTKQARYDLADRRRMTHWAKATDTIRSGYGEITEREWCEREVARNNRCRCATKVVTRGDEVAVAWV